MAEPVSCSGPVWQLYNYTREPFARKLRALRNSAANMTTTNLPNYVLVQQLVPLCEPLRAAVISVCCKVTGAIDTPLCTAVISICHLTIAFKVAAKSIPRMPPV